MTTFFFILFFTSCQTKEQKEKKEALENLNRTEELTSRAIHSNERIDSIFMDFRFGMSEKEYASYLNHVAKERGAEKNVLGEYEIPIKAAYSFRYKATLHPEFYNGKLCRLVIRADDEIGDNSNSYIMLFSTLRKSHPEYDIHIDKSIEDYPTYMAFYKNLIIRCYSSGSAILVYEDAPASSAKDREKEIKDSIDIANTF